MYRVVIAGTKGKFSRALFTHHVCHSLETLDGDKEILIRDERAQVDWMALDYAEAHGMPVQRFPADWQGLGSEAGLKRNEHLALTATHAIVFWDGFSRDIRDLLQRLKKYGVKCKLVVTEFQ